MYGIWVVFRLSDDRGGRRVSCDALNTRLGLDRNGRIAFPQRVSTVQAQQRVVIWFTSTEPERQDGYSPRSRPRPFGAGDCSIAGSTVRSRYRDADRSWSRAERRPASNRALCPLSRSGFTASSAAMRSPVAASSCCFSAARSSVTSSVRSRAGDLDVEALLRCEMGVIRLHRLIHDVHGPALGRVHGRGPGAVDVAKLRIAGRKIQHAPVLEAERLRHRPRLGRSRRGNRRDDSRELLAARRGVVVAERP